MSKSIIVQVRVTEEEHDDFKNYCDDKFTTKSQVLYSHIKEKIKLHKSKPISLTELRNKNRKKSKL